MWRPQAIVRSRDLHFNPRLFKGPAASIAVLPLIPIFDPSTGSV